MTKHDVVKLFLLPTRPFPYLFPTRSGTSNPAKRFEKRCNPSETNDKIAAIRHAPSVLNMPKMRLMPNPGRKYLFGAFTFTAQNVSGGCKCRAILLNEI